MAVGGRGRGQSQGVQFVSQLAVVVSNRPGDNMLTCEVAEIKT